MLPGIPLCILLKKNRTKDMPYWCPSCVKEISKNILGGW
uniref:Uncharacterized protein n=1 Tax=Anguilla anguilla TaxID=7936 RepID=A0A0E9P9N1_ANGAN